MSVATIQLGESASPGGWRRRRATGAWVWGYLLPDLLRRGATGIGLFFRDATGVRFARRDERNRRDVARNTEVSRPSRKRKETAAHPSPRPTARSSAASRRADPAIPVRDRRSLSRALRAPPARGG